MMITNTLIHDLVVLIVALKFMAIIIALFYASYAFH